MILLSNPPHATTVMKRICQNCAANKSTLAYFAIANDDSEICPSLLELAVH